MANALELRKPLSSKHLELIELMIAEPHLRNTELAARLNLTECWVSTLKNSDLFQEEYRKRVAEHRALVSERIIHKTEDVVDKTLDRMTRALDSDAEIGLGRLAQVYDITTKRLFPEQRGGGTVVNIALADPDAIRRARERAERLRTGELLDVSPSPEPA